MPVVIKQDELVLRDVLDGFNWDLFDRYSVEVIEELQEAYYTSAIEAGAEPTQAQTLSVEYARARGAELLKLEGNIFLQAETQRRIGALIADAIENGDSIQQLTTKLREDFAFSRERAARVARTETTTALGQGSYDTALVQGKTEKRWFTQGDALVEQECQLNANADWIVIASAFPSGHQTIPVHPNCRCAVNFRVPPLATESWHTLDEVRCSQGHLVAKKIPVGAVLYCRKCKVEFTAAGVADNN